MNKVIGLLGKYSSKVNKYYLTILIFVIVTFFIGDSTLFQRYIYDKKIKNLRSEIKRYEEEIEQNKAKLKSIRENNESLERYAREEFLMTKNDEDLYIVTP